MKLLVALTIAFGLAGTLSACSTKSMDMKAVGVVIDVRTPLEYSQGHLQGAQNIDVEGANFATEIDALDHNANYVLYCHSGRRAGLALDYMKSNGFTGTLTNAGAIADAAELTMLPIVQ
jgi:phage shock protein E